MKVRIRCGDLGDRGVQLARRDERLRPVTDDGIETSRNEGLRLNVSAAPTRSSNRAREFGWKGVEVDRHGSNVTPNSDSPKGPASSGISLGTLAVGLNGDSRILISAHFAIHVCQTEPDSRPYPARRVA